MNEAASRWLFLAEVLVLALPCLVFMTIYAVLFGGYALLGAAGMVLNVLAGGFQTSGDAIAAMGMSVLLLVIVAIAIAGLIAIAKFVRVATSFLRGGRARVVAEHRRFRQGLAFAAPALAVMLPMVWLSTHGGHPIDYVFAYLGSGLALLPPVLHLWLELSGMPEAEPGP